MKTLSWYEATLSQLYEISCNDPDAPMIYKQQAAEEIVRRQKRKQKPYHRNNFKVQREYPRW